MNHEENLEEQKRNEIDACSLCGFCKYNCPVFKATKKESLSPRGRAIMLKKKHLDSKVFFKCSLCKACENVCPIDINFRFEEQRTILNEKGGETEANRKMIENIRKYGNPFGKIKKGEIPDKLYCC
jgi:Fe-S oxidoreductase